jgi:hypothetical protein
MLLEAGGALFAVSWLAVQVCGMVLFQRSAACAKTIASELTCGPCHGPANRMTRAVRSDGVLPLAQSVVHQFVMLPVAATAAPISNRPLKWQIHESASASFTINQLDQRGFPHRIATITGATLKTPACLELRPSCSAASSPQSARSTPCLLSRSRQP